MSVAPLPTLRTLAGMAVDVVLPPRCLACGAIVQESGTLCGPCWRELTFLTDPMCARCGFPFEVAPAGEPLCGACIARPPRFAHARAALAYDSGSRGLVTAFKHADRTDAARAFAAWMARVSADLPRPGAVVPVPLHRRRLLRRRYNQSALLARELSRCLGVPAVPDGLVRARDTASQGDLSPAARRRNVAGAFAAHPKRVQHLRGQRVLLVDDVFTTGATVEACARVLERAGAEGVDVVTLARVPQPRPV
ncbi:comF family protein [Limimonas halophila]|uniref:ComF family protein n=1 Tax=Limimonas halophila TaxID=1082479 RepID=A0A1G7PXJ7_9PROT|nr:ComF family protein [Limimonas halophila]SDF90975.1 comF family protein [Limimonas halophila]